ncbi:MAG: lipopolysaccharide assembly protein LapA domain-containing protein [Candidatus Omnitrophota bacterium]
MKPKVVFIGILAILAGIILLQNTQVVTFHVLFWKISMSCIIFFAIVLAVGFAAGYFFGRKYWRS